MPFDEGIIQISQKTFGKLSTKLLDKIKNCILMALKKCENNNNQIDKILMVGGGSRMPMIKNVLKEMFPKSEFCCPQHPDEIVAVGDACYMYYLDSLIQHIDPSKLVTRERLKNRRRKNVERIYDREEDETVFKKFKASQINYEFFKNPTLLNNNPQQLFKNLSNFISFTKKFYNPRENMFAHEIPITFEFQNDVSVSQIKFPKNYQKFAFDEFMKIRSQNSSEKNEAIFKHDISKLTLRSNPIKQEKNGNQIGKLIPNIKVVNGSNNEFTNVGNDDDIVALEFMQLFGEYFS